MATNNHNHLQLAQMDNIEPANGPHNDNLPPGHNLLVNHGGDAPLRIGPPNHGSTALRSNDLPSSSRGVQFPGYKAVNTGSSHASFVHYLAGSSSSNFQESAVSYPLRSEEILAPARSHLDIIRAAMKRKHTVMHPMEGIGAGGYHVGGSSSNQLSNYVQPNPTPPTEPLHPPMSSNISTTGWDDQQLIQQEIFQRNVRARPNITLEPAPVLDFANIHLPSFRSAASTFLSTSVGMNQAQASVPTRTVPSGTLGITSRTLMERPYYPPMGSASSSAAAVPIVHGSLGSATYANGDPRIVHNGAFAFYSHPAPSAPSGSGAIPHGTVFARYPPATSASIRIGQPFPTRAAASSGHARHVAVGHANNGRSRRARSSLALHALMVEAEGSLVLEPVRLPREAADPHRDMRLDVDNMSYEDLLALGEFIGNVNTGLTDEAISKCMREVFCCSSDPSQNDQDDGSCVVCMEDYEDMDLLGVLKCSHEFHADCIKKWLKVKNSCPVCKAAAA